VILRPAKTSDAAGIAAVHVAGWQAAYRHLLPAAYLDALDPAEREAQWSTRLAGRRVREHRSVPG